MTTRKLIKNALTEEDIKWFKKWHPKHKILADVVEWKSEHNGLEEGGRTIIVTGRYTPSYCYRKVKDGYIYAGYSSYTKFDKDFNVVQADVIDGSLK